MRFEQLTLAIADELAPVLDSPQRWISAHSAKLRELARARGARLVIGAVRAAAQAGARRLDFFDTDAPQWLRQAEQEQRATPPPAREPVACPACGELMALRWCRVCGYEVGDSREQIDECRAAWLGERRDPSAAQAKREAVLADFRATLPWNQGRQG